MSDAETKQNIVTPQVNQHFMPTYRWPLATGQHRRLRNGDRCWHRHVPAMSPTTKGFCAVRSTRAPPCPTLTR